MRYPWNASPAGKLAVWLGITLWCLLLSSPLSAQKAKPRATLRGHSKAVESLAFSPDGKTLASGSADNSLKIWDVATGRNTATLRDEDAYHWRSVAFSPDGKTLASGGVFNKVKLWDVAARKGTILLDNRAQNPERLVVFSPDGKTLVSGGRCVPDMRLWDVASCKNTATLKGYDAYGVSTMAFSPDGKILAAMGIHDGIKLWDMAAGNYVPEPPPPEAAAKLIAQLGSADFRSRQQASAELARFGMPVLPALRQALTAKNELEVRRRLELLINEIEDATLMGIESVRSAAFSPDCKTLATVGSRDNNSVKMWEVATGKEQAALKGHTADVWPVVFSPDGKTLASGSEDGTIKLWVVATGKERATLRGHTGKVSSLAYRADGRVLASGSVDRTIKIWVVAEAK